MLYSLIIAGGGGTRLWPMSRPDRPKQLLRLIGGRSLLELAAQRTRGLVPEGHMLVCTAERYRNAVRSAVPDLGDEQIIGEPAGRDTANAIGLPAAILARRDPGAIIAVFTADHLIEPLDEFQRRVKVGMKLVADDPRRLVTFSIKAAHAATNYGYVERGEAIAGCPGAFRARHFKEKPDAETARRYLANPAFGWNSGMFVFAAATYLEALARFLPDARAGLDAIAAAWDSPRRQQVLAEVYPRLPRISVDYGIMERAATDAAFAICVVTMDVSWMDVGSWPSYGQTLAADESGNRGTARALHLGSRGVLAVSDDPGHLIATIGCKDLVVVHTGDVTLVCPASEAEKVKEMAEEVQKRQRD